MARADKTRRIRSVRGHVGVPSSLHVVRLNITGVHRCGALLLVSQNLNTACTGTIQGMISIMPLPGIVLGDIV